MLESMTPADPLGEALHFLRMSGTFYCRGEFSAPWALELPAIIIAGGAGLRLAHGLLFPGLLPRQESVARAGADAVKLVLGCLPLLVIAGVIEAFVSPTDLATTMKFGMSGAIFALLLAYLFSGYRLRATGFGS